MKLSGAYMAISLSGVDHVPALDVVIMLSPPLRGSGLSNSGSLHLSRASRCPVLRRQLVVRGRPCLLPLLLALRTRRRPSMHAPLRLARPKFSPLACPPLRPMRYRPWQYPWCPGGLGRARLPTHPLIYRVGRTSPRGVVRRVGRDHVPPPRRALPLLATASSTRLG